MTLYRFLEGIDNYDEWKIIDEAWETGTAPRGTLVLRDIGGDVMREYMVPIVPCEHGNYAEHVNDDECYIGCMGITFVWCPGAGLEDTE